MISARLASYYAAYFAVIGILLPFWPIWLESRGLNAIDIGFVLAAAPFVRVLTNPLIAQFADQKGLRQPIILGSTIAALLVFISYNFISDFWPILLITALFFTLFSAGQPLAESLTMQLVKENQYSYGRIRLWGSITFIITAILGGRMIEVYSINLVFYLSLMGLGLLFISSLILPSTRFPISKKKAFPILVLLRTKPFLIMLIAAASVQSSHAVVYSFSALHWQSIGFSKTLIGGLWAEGVIAEIILFQYSSFILKRIKPSSLILIGGMAGVVRWTILGLTDFLPALIIAQFFHGLTFGAVHLGAIHYISDHIPSQLSATAQSLLSAVVMGLAIGTTTIAAGMLYSSIGSNAYFPMAGLAALGATFALILLKYRSTKSSEP
ncbi:MAG: major facilitator superfamily domain-containing protein 6 [Pseudomonadota bacterium]|nr:major facilitator superfamily domain-containing protein 6 [Pseudomonadota bacterium]